MAYEQWNKYKSNMGPVDVQPYDPVLDVARDAAQEYFKRTGAYACNPQFKFRSAIEEGRSNFEFKDVDSEPDSFYDADSGAGLRRVR